MVALKQHDYFQGLEVTGTSEHFCFFGKRRISWSKIEKMIKSGERVQHRLSPNTKIDWSNKDEVTEYHNSFKFWSTYISGYSDRFKHYQGILEVKDGLVNYNGEYFLPSPVSKWEGGQNWWNAKRESIEDGKYNVLLLKQENDWYPREDLDRGNIILNLFVPGSRVKNSVKELSPNTTELWAAQYDFPITFDYHSSVLDGTSFYLRRFNSTEFFKKYFIDERWGNNKNIELSDKEIYDIMYPIEDQISEILREALAYRQLSIDIDNSWGEVTISNMLQFNSNVAEKVFGIVTKRIEEL